MSEQQDETPVRDFAQDGDVGPESRSSFAESRDGAPAGNDERLGNRGRATGSSEAGFLDDLAADRAARTEPGASA